jgi:Subtilase family
MPTSHVTDILHAKHAAFFIAALIASLAMESRSAEVIPPKPDRYFNDYAGVVSKEPAYRFNQEIAQFEPLTSNALRNRIDSSNDSAFVSGVLKVRFDDRGPGQTAAEEHPGSASAGTPTKRTVVTVTSTAAEREEQDPATPRGTTPAATATGKPVPNKTHDGRAWRPWLLIIFVIAALIVISRIPLRRRDQKRKGEKFPSYYPLRIAIELKSGVGKPQQQLDGWQASLEGTAKQLAPLRLLPLFESQDSIDQLVDRARRNDPAYEPADFSAWFQVETPAGVKADELVKRLRKLDNIETAYVIRPNPPPGVMPEDDIRNKRQHYQDKAPRGIDARFAWGFFGGDGAGIGFVDLEQGWNLNHRDLKDAKITIISGINRDDYTHGTSVLGEVLMVDNTIGGVGIAPSAKGRVISLWRTDSSPNTADAIRRAIATMSFGDVLLLEVQETDPISETDYWPAEILQPNYIAIRLATAMGIVVVEAAGNGGYDLDRYTNATGRNIFDRSYRDSRAIMVGAGSSGAGSSEDPHTKLPFSNHGKRIDCYAWGENINTTITNDTGGSITEYTTRFDGTSGAAPIVAGAALIVQGIAQFSLGRRFSPLDLRDLLTTNGTPSAYPATDKIGVMPDLKAIITNNQIKLRPVPIPTLGPS